MKLTIHGHRETIAYDGVEITIPPAEIAMVRGSMAGDKGPTAIYLKKQIDTVPSGAFRRDHDGIFITVKGPMAQIVETWQAAREPRQ